MPIQDKVVLITGASSGIGEATALELSQRGAKLILAARRQERLAELAAKLSGPAFFLPTDVTDVEQVKALVEQGIAHFGHLDILVNNAGLGHMSPMIEAPLEDWTRMVNVNIQGFLNVLHTALPHLVESKGDLVNLASVAAHNVWPNSVVYAGTKHFVKVVSKGLRLELRDKVRILNLSPGAVETEFIEQVTHPEIRAQYEKAFQGALLSSDIAKVIADALDSDKRMVFSEIIIRPNK